MFVLLLFVELEIETLSAEKPPKTRIELTANEILYLWEYLYVCMWGEGRTTLPVSGSQCTILVTAGIASV